MANFHGGRQALVFAGAFCFCVAQVCAQGYPSKVVRLVVPSTAGSGGDVIVRIITPGLSEIFKQQVIVDNRAGAAQNIGAELVARAPADGYTLLNVSSTLTANLSLYRNLPYDLVRDSAVAQWPLVVDLRRKVALKFDPAIGSDAARAVVTLAGGARHEAAVRHCRGSAGRPMSDEDITAKTRGQLSIAFDAPRVEQIIAESWRIGELRNAAALCGILVAA